MSHSCKVNLVSQNKTIPQYVWIDKFSTCGAVGDFAAIVEELFTSITNSIMTHGSHQTSTKQMMSPETDDSNDCQCLDPFDDNWTTTMNMMNTISSGRSNYENTWQRNGK